jgi:hypothetical protein
MTPLTPSATLSDSAQPQTPRWLTSTLKFGSATMRGTDLIADAIGVAAIFALLWLFLAVTA